MNWLETLKMMMSVAHQDQKHGESVSRIFRKSFARYRKHGKVGMQERLKKEYLRPDFPYAGLQYRESSAVSHRAGIQLHNLLEEYQQLHYTSQVSTPSSVSALTLNATVLESLQSVGAEHKQVMIEGERERIYEEFLHSLAHINGFEIPHGQLEEYLDGCGDTALKIYEEKEKNAHLALEIAKKNLVDHRMDAGVRYLLFSIDFKPISEAYELLGNTYLEKSRYDLALKAYHKANLDTQHESDWLSKNIEQCIRASWQKRREEFKEAFLIEGQRESFAQDMIDLTQDTYQQYVHMYTRGQPVLQKKISTGTVLIIGDYHVSQCIRYRINQKVEQLERQGHRVITQNWTELSSKPERIAESDIVIFYRTPAVIEVIKAMAHARAMGKMTFYEIDDLLFDTEYPAPIESYGGTVNAEVYHSLIDSMALSRAAATLCEYGIASTKSLQQALAPLVEKKECLLHRNGLDSENKPLKPLSKKNQVVTIFYGSGTLAHNSDFIIEALPAITRIMMQFPHVQLMIVGHLTLPSALNEQFPGRIKKYPKTKELKRYWEYLQQATINIATLHDDKLNGAKSELKWFEAAFLNIPSVVSSTANYRDVIHHGKNGMMAATEDEWYHALLQLIESPELREKIATQAHHEVMTQYNVDVLGEKLSQELQRMAAQHNATVKIRKKIALVNVYFPPQTIGGATRVVSDNLDVLRAQYADDYDIVAFTTDPACVEPYQLSIYQYKGIPVYKSTILWRENMDWHARDEHMYQIFKDFLALEQPDLVHFHCVQRMTGSVVEATLDAHIPYLVTVHDAWWISDYQFLVDPKGKVYPDGHIQPDEKRVLPNNVTLKESKARTAYLKHLLNSAQRALVVSESFAQIYRQNGIHNVAVTRNGLSTTVNWQPKNTAYTEKVVCALIGGMSAHKGYKLLQDTIVQYQPQHIELLIVDLSKPAEYESRGEWDGVPVRFVGKQTEKTIVSLYQQIDVLLAPSIWPESFGLVSREAAACGCWVVASKLGGMGEDVIDGETGFVIDPTVTELDRVLKIIDAEPVRYKGLAGVSERRYVTQQVEQLVEVYQKEV